MKILAWNLAHQTRELKIRPGFYIAVETINPDVIVLNEYVHGASRQPLIDGLSKLGYSNVNISKRISTNNQVLIAAKERLTPGDLPAPSMGDGVSESNFLHVRLDDPDIAIVGLRAPTYKTSTEMHRYWEMLSEVIQAADGRRIVFIGDLNADANDPKSLGGKYLRQLAVAGWQLTDPIGEWSYHAGTRIDHAIVSDQLRLDGAEYVTSLGDTHLASSDSKNRVSDHAALVITLSTQR